ncbi:MAG: cbb3-type cytochrome c oxidase subunit 3, partial [Pseudomonadota bacterium]
WGLLYLFLIFCGVIIYSLRPGIQQTVDDAASIPFKEDE